jgi:hypothetical protein
MAQPDAGIAGDNFFRVASKASPICADKNKIG